MQFWSGTAFMTAADSVAVAPLLDDAGFDGIVTSDHMIYPRELSSPYPDSSTGKPPWQPDNSWPDAWVLTGAMAAVTRRVRFANAIYIAPARPLLEVARLVATASDVSGGRVALAAGVGWMRERVRVDGSGVRHPRQATGRDDSGTARTVEGRLGVVDRHLLPRAGDDDRAAPARAGADSLRRGVRGRAAASGAIVRRLGGNAYSFQDAVGFAQRLTALRREYGRANEPFDILLALLEPPSVDLYRRAEEAGITQVMVRPWGVSDPARGGEQFRAPIQRFADDVIDKFR